MTALQETPWDQDSSFHFSPAAFWWGYFSRQVLVKCNHVYYNGRLQPNAAEDVQGGAFNLDFCDFRKDAKTSSFSVRDLFMLIHLLVRGIQLCHCTDASYYTPFFDISLEFSCHHLANETYFPDPLRILFDLQYLRVKCTQFWIVQSLNSFRYSSVCYSS